MKIVRVMGGKLCGKKRRFCGNCAGFRNHVDKQIFDHRAQNEECNEECNNCLLSLAIKHKPNFFFATTLAKVCINKIMLHDIKFIQNRNSRA